MHSPMRFAGSTTDVIDKRKLQVPCYFGANDLVVKRGVPAASATGAAYEDPAGLRRSRTFLLGGRLFLRAVATAAI